MKNKLGLYLHIPFCAAKCAYCDFYSLANRRELWDEYTDELVKRLTEWGRKCGGYTVDTVYFGGGTPSLLGGDRLFRILDAICSGYALDSGAEITCEANPDSMTDDFLKKARLAGVNRLSMGIQSANDDELKMLGRIHSFAQARDAFYRARKAGFDNISVDLMYALPGQSMDSLRHSIEQLLALEPEHISCYGLTVEPDTPLGRQNPTLPDEDTQADMYMLLCEMLRGHGFEHYEISNFAKSGRRSRHNSRYWVQSEYLGFGPGAHSDFGGERTENPRDYDRWLAGERYAEDDDIDRAAEALMLALRTSDGIDGDEWEKRFSRDFSPIERVLRPLIKLNYVQQNERRWRLTEAGFLISNPILVSVLEAIE